MNLFKRQRGIVDFEAEQRAALISQERPVTHRAQRKSGVRKWIDDRGALVNESGKTVASRQRVALVRKAVKRDQLLDALGRGLTGNRIAEEAGLTASDIQVAKVLYGLEGLGQPSRQLKKKAIAAGVQTYDGDAWKDAEIPVVAPLPEAGDNGASEPVYPDASPYVYPDRVRIAGTALSSPDILGWVVAWVAGGGTSALAVVLGDDGQFRSRAAHNVRHASATSFTERPK
jgi:hypothetical protein